MSNKELWVTFVLTCSFALLMVGFGGYLLFGNSAQENRQLQIPAHVDFMHECANNGGNIIESWRGEISCSFPVGVFPPDLNNH